LLAERKASLLKTFLQQAKESTKIEIIKDNLGKPNAVNTSGDSFGPPGFPVQ
jgi:dTDP-4-dehydrorhamnose reductase